MSLRAGGGFIVKNRKLKCPGIIRINFVCLFYRYNNCPRCWWWNVTGRFHCKEQEIEMQRYHQDESHCWLSGHVNGMRLSSTVPHTEYSRHHN